MAIVLPSGVGSGDFAIAVEDGGHFLLLSVNWPGPLINMSLMHRRWLTGPGASMETYHTKSMGFEAALRQFREVPVQRYSDPIASIARISLPFAVQMHIEEKHNLSWKEEETKIMYFDLKACFA